MNVNKNCILIADDDFINRELLKNIFSSQFTFEEAENGKDGLEKIKRHKAKLCAIILDVEMPEMTGLELLEIISDLGITEAIPTFLITAHDDSQLVENAYRFGVMDVVSKPVTAVVVERRVKTVIELFNAREQLHETVKGQEIKLSENAKEMDALHRSTLEALATAIEFRDIESGQHVSRIYGMTKYILTHTAFGAGLTEDEIENMAIGSIMHDVGKIAISDVILNKPGRLTHDEFEIMKQHTVKGAALLEQILGIQTHQSYIYACDIAHHHHERWDGNGYPDGLKGNHISVAAQVVSIVDVYDALISPRVYKAPFTPEQAVQMIQNGECGIFNPALVECFTEAEPVIRNWYMANDPDNILKELTAHTKRSGKVYSEKTEENSGESVTDIMLLMTAVQNTYDALSAVNLTQNTFRLIGLDRMGIHSPDRKGGYDDIINIACEHIPVSHRREFREKFSRDSLLKAFRNGKKSVRMEYPQITDDGSLRWLSTKVLLMQDSRSGDVFQITLMQYTDEEHQQREITRKLLSDAQNITENAGNVKTEVLNELRRDMQNPLTSIAKLATDMAQNAQNAQKISEYAADIQKATDHLLHILQDNTKH